MPGEAVLADHVGMMSLAWNAHNPVESPPLLEPGAIHLWTLDLARYGQELARYLIQSDRDRGSRILDESKRRLYLGGRAGMRLLLSAYTGIAFDAIRFGYGSRGKPVLANEETPIRPLFNYTLSRDKVLYALSLDHELGVDMEVLPRPAAAKLLAARKLTAAEQAAWRGVPHSLQNNAMLCCWTRKEAFGKALGVGIRYNLGQVSLFNDLASSRFRTAVRGLFDDTDSSAMPEHLEGIQLGLPFDAVAALMYPTHRNSSLSPSLSGSRLVMK